MKTWKRALALVMALGMSFSIVACGDDDDSSSSSGNGGNGGGGGTTTPTTEAEIYKYVADALTATEAYTGDATITMSNTETSKETDEEGVVDTYESTDTSNATLDSVNQVMYSEMSYNGSSYTMEIIGKSFVQGGKYYVYQKQTRTMKPNTSTPTSITPEAQTMEGYAEYAGAAKDEFLEEMSFASIAETIADQAGALKLAATFDELKSAVSTAFPVIASAEFEVENPTTSTEVKATANNGVYTVSVKMSASMTYTEGDETETYTTVIDVSMSAKDGKIVSAKQTMTENEQSTRKEGTETLTASYESADVAEITVAYAFDKAKYDALAVQLPTDPTEIEVMGGVESYNDVYVDIYVNGDRYTSGSCYEPETPAQAFAMLTNNVNYGDRATVTWYKDAACTQAIDASALTQADIFAMKELYAKVVPTADYAMIEEVRYSRYDYSKPYQIVLALLEGGSSYSDNDTNRNFSEAGEYSLDSWYVESENYEIIVNGTKMNPKAGTIAVEAGKTYKVEYVRVYKDPVAYTESAE